MPILLITGTQQHGNKQMNEVKLIPADKAIKMMDALISISAEIKTTNNGKLMIKNIERTHRPMVPELVAAGALKYAAFINCRDSVISA